MTGAYKTIGFTCSGGTAITFVIIYLVLVLLCSLAVFGLYGLDKRRATDGGRRIPEKWLQALALLGGWPGAWFAQRHFRHKTRKFSFQLVFWCLVLLHLASVAYLADLYFR